MNKRALKSTDSRRTLKDHIIAVYIRTQRTDMLGVLQLMICTFYLGNELGYERGINMHSPGAPKWGGKLWSMKLEGYV